jgi:ketosteroid isomerase-like protein
MAAGQDLEILDANEAFYRAFAEHDADAMEALWAEAAPVSCIHPGWDALEGREEVLQSWRSILEAPSAPEIQCTLASAHVLGDVGFVVCHERLPGTVLVATNLFQREGGAWRMVHHQAGPIALGQVKPDPTPRGPAN